jgi:hypothetical protein
MGRVIVALIVAGCGGGTPSLQPRPRPPADAAPIATADAGELRAIAGDPPEPTPPVVECAFERVVHCEPESPTLSAVGPPGFESCRRIGDAAAKGGVGPRPVAELSPAETRRGRIQDPHRCCYVEFVATACD